MKALLVTHHRRRKASFRSGNFARELARRNHEITLLCTSNKARIGVKEYDKDGVHYVEAPDLLFGNLRSGWDAWSTYRRVRWLKGKSYDLVHAFDTRPATIYPVLSYLETHWTPLIIDWCDWWGRGGLIKEQRPFWYGPVFGPIETYYEEHFRTHADATTVISHALGKRAERLGVPAETIHWIPNGASANEVQPTDPKTHRDEFGLPKDACLLFDSALDVTIGTELALRAVKIAARKCPQILMVMTGGKAGKLKAAARKIGVEEHFRHLGILPYASLLKALACADMFVFPFTDTVANRGRWPGRMGLFLPMGRPVVTNPVGEMETLLATEEIGLAARETPEDMAEQIATLVSDPALRNRLGANARRLAETTLSWSHITDEIERCYADARDRFSRRPSRRRPPRPSGE